MGPAKPATELGRRLRALRLARGLSVAAAAKATGVSKTHLWDLEKKPMNPSHELLLKIAPVYGVSISELLGEDVRIEGAEPRLVRIYRDLTELTPRDLDTVESIIRKFREE